MASDNATSLTSTLPPTPPIHDDITNNCTQLCAIEDPQWCDNFFVGLRSDYAISPLNQS